MQDTLKKQSFLGFIGGRFAVEIVLNFLEKTIGKPGKL